MNEPCLNIPAVVCRVDRIESSFCHSTGCCEAGMKVKDEAEEGSLLTDILILEVHVS